MGLFDRLAGPVLALAILLAGVEAVSRAVWKAKGGPARLQLYAERLQIASSYRYFDGDPAQAEALARHCAGLINAFRAELERKGVGLILVIHPAMWEVYLSPQEARALGADFELPKTLLKRGLDRGLPVLDLTRRMQDASGESPESLYWLDDDHYSPAGYAAAAEPIAAFLAQRIPHPGP